MTIVFEKISEYWSYVEHLLILNSTVTGWVSISAFTSLIAIPVVITSSAVVTQICAINSGVKKCKSVIIKKGKKHDTLVLLEKDKLDTLEVLFSKVLICSYVSHDEFISVNNLYRE